MLPILNIWKISLLLTSVLSFCSAQVSTPYCQSPTNDQPKPPSLPDKFSFSMEQFSTDAPYIMFAEESYDKERNQLALKFQVNSQEAQTILDFNSDQLFDLAKTDDEYSCSTYNCSSDDMCQMVLNEMEPQLSKSNLSSHRIFAGFHLFGIDDDNPPVYMGVEQTSNGVYVERWDTCEPGGMTNRSVYWTVQDWTTPGAGRMPFSVTMTTTMADQTIRNYTMTVAMYKPNYVDGQAFQMPEGFICDKWQSERKFPSVPDWATAFELQSEVVQSVGHNIGRTHEWFDVSEALFRLDQEQMRDAGGNTAMTEIIDKTQGKMYAIFGASCSQYDLDETTFSILTSTAASTPLLQASENKNQISDFFADEDTKYLFVGEQKTRNVNSFVWEGVRRGSNGVGSTIEALWRWYFIEGAVPVKRALLIYENGDSEEGSIQRGTRIYHQIYNFRYLAKDKMDPKIFDLTSCFKSDEWLHLKVQISAVKQANGRTPDPEFFRLWRKTLAQQSGLQLLGIADTEIRTVDELTWLQFKFLPIEAVGGGENTQKANTYSIDILTANREKLQTAINNHQVSIIYQNVTVQATGLLQDVVVTDTSTVAHKTDEPTTVAHKPDEPTTAAHKSDEPTTVAHKPDEPTTVAHKTDETTTVAHKSDEPTTVAHKPDEPTTVAHKTDETTTVAHKTDEPTTVAHKPDEPTTVAHKTDETTTVAHKTQKLTSDKPYSAGVAAAVGASFILLGFGVASGGTYFYVKYRSLVF